MARDRDIFCVFNGGDPFSTTHPMSEEADLTAYFQKIKTLADPHQIFQKSCGVDEDVGANVDSLMNEIRGFTNKQLNRIGQVCLLGRSAGCHLALCLAAELNDLGITDITFVGVSDVPMWDIGRQPPVRKVGAFKPINDPTQAGMHGRGPFLGPAPLNPSDPASKSIPTVKLDRDIKAKRKLNLYQIEGNHTKFASSVKRWIWTSRMSDGEIHGELLGFDENRRRSVSPNLTSFNADESRHINLNTGEHWKQMVKEAAAAFADIQ